MALSKRIASGASFCQFRSIPLLALFVLVEAGIAVGQPFVEVAGRLRFEAEDFSSRRAGTGEWIIVPDEGNANFEYENQSGVCNTDGVARFMTPTDDVSDRNTDVFDQGPTLTYDIRILTTGEYQIWVRRAGATTGSDSMFVRIRGRGQQPFPPFHFGGTSLDLTDGWQATALETLDPGLYQVDIAARESNSAIDAIVIDRTGSFDGTDAAAAAIPCSARCEPVGDVSHLPADAVNLAAIDVPTQVAVTVGIPQPRDGTVTVTSSNAAVAGDTVIDLAADNGTCAGALVDVLDVDSGTTTLNLTNSMGFNNGAGRQINVIGLQSIALGFPFAAMAPGDTQSSTVIGDFAAAGFRDLTAGSTYESSDPGVVAVDGAGNITAVALGQADITARNGAESSTQSIVVAERVTRIAFVVGSRTNNLSPADQAALDHLRSLRFSGDPGQLDAGGIQAQVVPIDDDDLNPPSVDAEFDLLLSSSTINADRVGGNFQCLSVPHVFWHPVLTGQAAEGVIAADGVAPEPLIDIFLLDNAHPITQGLPVDADGFVEIYASPQLQTFGNGETAAGVDVLADTGFEGDQYLLAGESGTLRLGGSSTFLGRRVFIGIGDDAFDDLNDNGRTLFNQAVNWALASDRLVCEGPAPEPFVEIAGLLRFEAENFHDLLPNGNGAVWMIVPDEDPGDGYFNERGACNADGMPRYITPGAGIPSADRAGPVFTIGPVVTYQFQILTAGDYAVWMRWAGFSGGSDSVFMRIREIGTTNTETPKQNDRFDLTDAWKEAFTETLQPGLYHLDIAARENNSGVDEIIIERLDSFDATDAGADLIQCSPRCEATDVVSHLPADEINLASVDVPVQVGIAVAIPVSTNGTVTITSSDPAVASDATVALTRGSGTCFGAAVDVLGVGTTELSLSNDAGFGNSSVTRRINVLDPTGIDLQLPTTTFEPGDSVAATVIGDFGAAGTRDLTDPATGTTYTSSNEAVARVDANGNVTAVGEGFAEITAANGRSSTRGVVVAPHVTKIAFLVGDTQLNEGDQAALLHLSRLSFTGDPGQLEPNGLPAQVLTFDDDNFDAADIDARFDLLITSSTVSSGNVGGAFRCLGIPHVFWEGALNRPDREGLTDASDSTPAADPATGDPIIDLFITDNTHPITTGLPLDPDTVVVFDSGQEMSGAKGTLAPEATVLADTGFTDVDGVPIWGLIATDAGTLRVDGASAFLGRRVFVFLGDDAFDNLTAEGRTIVNRSVNWALGGTSVVPPAASVGLFATSFARVGSNTQLLVETASADGECTTDVTRAPQTSYATSDASIATVDADGRVNALRAGEVTITVMHGGFEDSAVIRVVDPTTTVQIEFDNVGSAFDFDFIAQAPETWSVESNPLNADTLALRSNSNGGLGDDSFSRVAVVKSSVFEAANAEASVDVTWENDDDRSGVYLRFADPDNWYYLLVEGDDNLDDQVRLYRSRNGSVELLLEEIYSQAVDIDGTLGQTHTLTFRAEGDRLFGRIDGVPLPGLDPFVDPDPLRAAGRAGVGQNSNPSFYDNFTLTGLGVAAPALIEIADGLGSAPDTFISPLGEDVALTEFELTTDVPLATINVVGSAYTAAGAAPTVASFVSNGDGTHAVTLDGAVTPGHWLRLDLEVSGAGTPPAMFSVWLAHQPLDVNQDGETNIRDATAFGDVFNSTGEPRLININGDGTVNVRDATAFGNNWNGVSPLQVWRNTQLPARP